MSRRNDAKRENNGEFAGRRGGDRSHMTKDTRRKDEHGKQDRGGTYYSNDEEATRAAQELGRKQGPGAESHGTGSGGPGARSQKSRGG